MVFALTFIAIGLTAWLLRRTWRDGETLEATVSGRLCKLALLPTAAFALVGLVYSILSLPFVGVHLDGLTLQQLQALDEGAPEWARQFAENAPLKSSTLVLLALMGLLLAARRPFARSELERDLWDRLERLLGSVKRTNNALVGLACVLFAASSMTLFGNGLHESAGDVEREIRQVEFRIGEVRGQIASAAAAAIVEESIAAMNGDTTSPNARLALAARGNLATVKLRVDEFAHSLDQDPEIRRAALRRLELTQGPAATMGDARADFERETARAVAAQPAYDLEQDLRENFSLDEMARLGRPEAGAARLLPEGREFTKEVAAGIIERLMAAFHADPVLAASSHAFGPMVAEVLASMTSQAVLVPFLQRLRTPGSSTPWKDQLRSTVRAAARATSTSSHWSKADGATPDGFKSWADSVEAATSVFYLMYPPRVDGEPASPVPSVDQAFSSEESNRLARLMIDAGHPEVAARLRAEVPVSTAIVPDRDITPRLPGWLEKSSASPIHQRPGVGVPAPEPKFELPKPTPLKPLAKPLPPPRPLPAPKPPPPKPPWKWFPWAW